MRFQRSSSGPNADSADFSVDFMKKLNPVATVISSGDKESHAHPRAEAVGYAGRYSRGTRRRW